MDIKKSRELARKTSNFLALLLIPAKKCNILLKERLSGRRLLTSSEASMNGKLFIEFIALIFLSYINRKMQEKDLYKEYTMEKLLLELESIQSICEPGRAPIVCEVLEKQRKIYDAMDVMPPK